MGDDSPYPELIISGVGGGGLIFDYTIKCYKEEHFGCEEGCTYNDTSRLASEVKVSFCKTLGGVYDPVSNRCTSVDIDSMGSSNNELNITCRNSDVPCEQGELEVERQERWRACFLRGGNFGTREDCENAGENPLAVPLSMRRLWKCPGNNPDRCTRPVANNAYPLGFYACLRATTIQNILDKPAASNRGTAQAAINVCNRSNRLTQADGVFGDNCKLIIGPDFNSATGRTAAGKRYVCYETQIIHDFQLFVTHDFVRPVPDGEAKYRCCH